jgi:hypothetical protein
MGIRVAGLASKAYHNIFDLQLSFHNFNNAFDLPHSNHFPYSNERNTKTCENERWGVGYLNFFHEVFLSFQNHHTMIIMMS